MSESPGGDLAARSAALVLLQSVLQKHRSIDEGFDAAARGLEPRDRAFVRMLAATALRRLGQIDAVLSKFLTRAPADPVGDLLRLGTAQLLFLGTPAHAAVATTVALVKHRHAGLAGLANAVMRRVAEQGPGLVAGQDAAQLNTPEWLWRSWTGAYGEAAARAIAETHLAEPTLDLSVKDPAEASAFATKLGGVVLPGGSLRLPRSAKVIELSGFAEGAWWVQDAAAALPARILVHALRGAGGALRIGDLCAAPGGKTAQLAAAGFQVTAVDIAAERLRLLRENLARLGLKADVREADVLAFRPDVPFDAVLLDAPCSATGTIRRHPDLPHLKRAQDLAGLVTSQTRLLAAAARMVKPGGLILYSVCSLQPEERRPVVDTVLAADTPLARRPIAAAAVDGETQLLTAEGELSSLPCHWPERGGLDGFYAALLQRAH